MAAWPESRGTSLADRRDAQGRAHAAYPLEREVRCPHCDKKLGEYLSGVYRTTCPRCHREVTITR